MGEKRTITKKDLAVILGCGVFVLMISGAIGSSGRMRAKGAVCLYNLRQLAAAGRGFANDNDGYFPTGWLYASGGPNGYWPEGKGDWQQELRPYYKDKNIRFCPMAKKKTSETIAGSHGGTWRAWGPFPYEGGTLGNSAIGDDWGSYGINQFLYNHPPVGTVVDGYTVQWVYALGTQSFASYFHRIDVKNPDMIPMFTGSCFLTHAVENESYGPLPFENIQVGVTVQPHTQFWTRYRSMGVVQLNRHNGAVGGVFLDGAARKIPLKELWALKWSNTWDTCNQWTKCGTPDAPTLEAMWDGEAAWMSNMPEY